MLRAVSTVLLGLVSTTALFSEPVSAQSDISSYHIGNSLTEDAVAGAFGDFSSQRGITHEAGWHIDRGRSLPYIEDHPTPTNGYSSSHGTWDAALPGNAWDVVTLQLYPSDGSNLGSDVSAAVSLIDSARQNAGNQTTRFIIYGPWATRGGDYAADWTAAIDPLVDSTGTQRKRAYNQEVFARVKQARPDAQLELLLTGELFFKVDQAIKAEVAGGGDWFGYTDVDQLYRDTVHLDYEAGRWLASLAMWSAVTGESPAGLVRPDGRFETSGTSVLDSDPSLRAGLADFVAQSMDEIHVVPEPMSVSIIVPLILGGLAVRPKRPSATGGCERR